jgi:putative Holliday junction resolvase
MSDRTRRDRIMGLDVGGKRTGVAIADELGISANPVGFVLRGNRDRDEFRTIVARYGITRIVAGLPQGMSGREGPQAADVRSYAEALSSDLDLPIAYWDERFTSAMAERALIERGTRREKRREQIDAIAAAIMLQHYLDAQANRRQRGAAGRHSSDDSH